MPFWMLSCALLAHHLCHLFCYQVICFCAKIISNVALVLKGQKILFQSFLFRLGENLESYLFLLALFFLDEKRFKKKKKDSSPLSSNYFEFKSIVLKHVIRVQVILNGYLLHVLKEVTVV